MKSKFTVIGIFAVGQIIFSQKTVHAESSERRMTQKEMACDNLYVSACLNSGGANRQKAMIKSMSTGLKNEVAKAQQELAKSLGYSDLLGYVKTKLEKKLGLAIREDLSNDARKVLLRESDWASLKDSDILQDLAKCEANVQKLNEFKANEIEDVNILNSQIEKYQDLFKGADAIKVSLSTKIVPVLLSGLGEKCQAFKKLTLGQQSDSYLALLKTSCEQIPATRRMVLEWYRSEQDPNTKIEIQKWVPGMLDLVRLDIFGSYKNDKDRSEKLKFTPATAGDAIFKVNKQDSKKNVNAVTRLRSQLAALSLKANGICNIGGSSSSLFYSVISPELRLLWTKLAASRPVVESLIESFYSDSKKQRVQVVFDTVVEKVKLFVSRVVLDPKLRDLVISKYNGLTMGWLNRPDRGDYKLDSDLGVEYIDFNEYFKSNLLTIAFGSGSFRFFTTPNAFYQPETQFGQIHESSSVNIMPAFLWMYEMNPQAYLSVLAHEVGHQIGPILSLINGHDLRKVHGPVLQCLSDPKSIYMQPDQTEEAIADMVSAETIAQIIATIKSEEERVHYVMESIQPFCIFDYMENKRASVYTREDVHPNSILRVGGTYGANSSLRQAMGCQVDSKSYKTCGWK